MPESVHRLVERFEEQHGSYSSGRCTEARLCMDSLDPFFAALGRDSENNRNYVDSYTERFP